MRKRRDIRAPITEICGVLSHICFSVYEIYLSKAAYMLAYFGLLRVSELVFTYQLHLNRVLLNSDVQVEK